MRDIFCRFALVVLLITSVVGCTKYELTPVAPTPEHPSLEDMGDGSYYTTFYLPALWSFDDAVRDGDVLDVHLEFLPLAHRVVAHSYLASLTIGENYLLGFNINTEDSEDLPSMKYLLRGYSSLGAHLKHEFVVTVEDRMITEIVAVPDYSSGLEDGDGSKDNPYLISSENDFLDMCDLIAEDPSYGRGKYFKQVASFELSSNMGSTTVEEGWYCVPFAGSYDGMDYEIEGFAFNGLRDAYAKNIGLFSTLQNGAEIKNLRLDTNGMNGIAENGGILAGAVADNAVVSIRDCVVLGDISNSDKNIGGLIGYAGNATVVIDGVKIGMHLNSKGTADTGYGENTGGIIGYAYRCDLSISDVEIEADYLMVEGGECTGGLFGLVKDCDMNINKVDLERSVTKDIPVVSGKSNVGGLIGKLYLCKSDNSTMIRNTSVVFPISGVDNVGTIIGHSYNSGANAVVDIEDFYGSSSITGQYSLGGFIGYAQSSGGCTELVLNGDCYFGSINSNKNAIHGSRFVGGLVGYVGPNTSFSLAGAEVVVAATMEAVETCAGGLIGKADGLALNLHKGITMTSTSIVKSPNYVGGVVGYMNGGYLSGGAANFDFEVSGCSNIPSFSDVATGFCSTIKIESSSYNPTYAGGIAGFVDSNSEVCGIASSVQIKGSSQVGGAVGAAIGENIALRNIFTSGNVTGSGLEIGGVVGRIENGVTLYNSINYATVDCGTTGAEIGGVVGYSKYVDRIMPHIYYCVNTGSVKSCNAGGGVVGIAFYDMKDYSGTIMIEKCANFGDIEGINNASYKGYSGFGGILGNSYNSNGAQVAHCANFGNLDIDCTVHGVGGIVGAIGTDPPGGEFLEVNNFHVWECANHGDITGTGQFHCGGVAGYMEEGSSAKGNHACVEGCYNWGDIDVGVDDSHGLGGIAGYLDSYAEVWRNINFVVLTGYSSSKDNTGRVFGKKKGVYTNKYNYYATTGSTSGYAFNHNDMYKSEIFSELDINATETFWVMASGDPHPQIKNCPFQNATYTPKE